MSEPSPVGQPGDAVLFEELVDAWSSLGKGHRVPERIEVLKKHHKKKDPKVCRLVGCRSDGGDVVVKCSDRAAVEATLYEHVLATVPGTPRCHGIAPGRDAGCCWIFLEHIDGERCSAQLAEHRTLTARWLRALCSATSDLPSGRLLPRFDSGYYRVHLRTARERMSAALGGDLIDGAGRSRVAATVDRCDLLDRQWNVLETLTEDIPPSLVHGDLQAKNVMIRPRPGGEELVAIDWEFSGYGPPIADLAEFAVEQRWLELAGLVQQTGFPTGPTADRLRRLATAGRIFRLITWFEWESRGRRHPWQESTLRTIAFYDLGLDECLRSLAMDA